MISLRDVEGISCTEACLVRKSVFGVDFDLVDDCLEFTMVTNVSNICLITLWLNVYQNS